MKKAKTCFGCYANECMKCTLGYEQEKYSLTEGKYGLCYLRPKECCHKPKTISEYWKRYENYIKNGVKQ